MPRIAYPFRLIASLALLATLAACGSSQHHYVQRRPSRYYPPPGPASDPWGPYIREASGRFGVPERWIRGVMHQESGGQEDVISAAGAMGLMQVMPDTYYGLRTRYDLGADPFDPHNNILAGTAYLREMYDRFGSPGFLAAYNAGPNRLDRYLNNGTPLPDETVNYVASIAPRLGSDRPMSGPLAVYGAPVTVRYASNRRPTPAGCDPDAAYNPNGPCTPMPVQVASVIQSPAAQPPSIFRRSPAQGAPVFQPTPAGCDPDAAYNPNGPCTPMRRAVIEQVASVQYPRTDCDPDAAYDPTRRCRPVAPVQPVVRYQARPLQERMTVPVRFPVGPPPGRWMIQVGAFSTLSAAENAADRARLVAQDLLGTTKVELPATAPLGREVAFRARLSGLTEAAAAEACSRLSRRSIACMTVPPSSNSY